MAQAAPCAGAPGQRAASQPLSALGLRGAPGCWGTAGLAPRVELWPQVCSQADFPGLRTEFSRHCPHGCPDQPGLQPPWLPPLSAHVLAVAPYSILLRVSYLLPPQQMPLSWAGPHIGAQSFWAGVREQPGWLRAPLQGCLLPSSPLPSAGRVSPVLPPWLRVGSAFTCTGRSPCPGRRPEVCSRSGGWVELRSAVGVAHVFWQPPWGQEGQPVACQQQQEPAQPAAETGRPWQEQPCAEEDPGERPAAGHPAPPVPPAAQPGPPPCQGGYVAGWAGRQAPCLGKGSTSRA